MKDVTRHALARLADRLPELDPQVVRLLAEYADAHPRGSSAVRIGKLRAMRGEAWSIASNGDTAWAIVRSGRVVTAMLRRSTQPTRPESFGVDSVYVLA